MTIPPEKEVFSPDFVKKMRNRMLTSHYKYGKASEAYPDKINALACMRERMKLYDETGNKEWLVDAANFLMIEYMFPAHPEAHFRSTDSDESPGLVRR